jgi:hypothetical protein
MPRIPATLDTRETRFPESSDPSTRRMSPVGRSMLSTGAFGEDGEVKVYESEATWTLMSR